MRAENVRSHVVAEAIGITNTRFDAARKPGGILRELCPVRPKGGAGISRKNTISTDSEDGLSRTEWESRRDAVRDGWSDAERVVRSCGIHQGSEWIMASIRGTGPSDTILEQT